MNVLLALSVVLIIPLAFVVMLVIIRTGRPHSRKMAEEQGHLNVKIGGSSNRAAYPPSTEGYGKGLKWFGAWLKKLGSNLWFTLLVIAGCVIAYEGLYGSAIKSPRPGDVGIWSWQHWLPLLIFWGILATLIALGATKEWKKTLQKTVAAVMLTLLAGALIMSGGPAAVVTSAMPYRDNVVGNPGVLVIPPKGRSRLISVPPGTRLVMVGEGFVNHTVYSDGRDCAFDGNPCPNGDVVGSYAVNETNETNTVSYTFAPIYP